MSYYQVTIFFEDQPEQEPKMLIFQSSRDALNLIHGLHNGNYTRDRLSVKTGDKVCLSSVSASGMSHSLTIGIPEFPHIIFEYTLPPLPTVY